MAGRHALEWYHDWNWWSSDRICREWTKDQVNWLLYFLPDVLDGYWPKNPDNVTGYVDPQIYKPKRQEYKAVMEGIIATGALLEMRLFHCGIDGLLAEANITWNKSIESLTKALRGIPGAPDMSEEEVIKSIDRAIEYVVSFGLNYKKRGK